MENAVSILFGMALVIFVGRALVLFLYEFIKSLSEPKVPAVIQQANRLWGVVVSWSAVLLVILAVVVGIALVIGFIALCFAFPALGLAVCLWLLIWSAVRMGIRSAR